MWQQILAKAIEGANKTFNNVYSESGRGKADAPVQLGGQPHSMNPDNMNNMGNLGGLGNQQGGLGNQQGGLGNQQGQDMGSAAGSFSDDRTKIETPPKDLLSEVAEMINNYTYHYKPGVGEDPSVEYSGPMAQELLQVDGYRSCVFEDKSGLLKVDTGRLALVNTGLIADLSKRLLMLEEFIKAAMAGLTQGQAMPDVE